MEFPWISNVPGNHKQHSFLQKSNAASSSSFLLSSSSQSSSLSSSQAAAPPGFVRRPRADTMPAPSSPFVFSRDYTSSLDVPPQPTMRHRSGSATETRMRNGAGFSTTLFSSATLGSAASSPIDETGVASTLASLGLMEENEHNRYTPSETVPMLSVTTEPRSRGNSGGNLPTPTRGRAYTVGTRTPLEQPNVNRLLNFDPFSLDNETTGQQQRPRAISLGMADEPVPSSRLLYSATHNAAQRLQQQTQKQDSPLRTSASSGNLVGYMNYSDMPERTQDRSTQSSPSSSTAQVPSRALWLGNIDASLNVPELIRLFSCYGHVESARILSDKECAFVNFASVESAVAAKNDLETRLGSKVNGTTVRVGYGKADVNQAMANTSEAGPNAQGPTRALWIGNIPANMNPGILRAIFQPFGPIESVRVLSHKNCGFVNFEQQQDAVHARKALQNKEILGPGTGAVRIGFAKAPTASADESKVGEDKTNHFPAIAIHANPDTYQATQWATAMMMSSMMRTVAGDQQLSSASSSQSTSLYAAIAAERKFIMRQLGHEDTSPATEDRPPMAYCSAIPLIAELGSDRKLEPLRLREMRKKLDNGQQTLQDVEGMAAECMDEIVELCNDYIGNTVIQKLFECCSEATRLAMLEKIAPFLASIGVHKNGTWAAQKIIDSAESPVLIRTISVHVAPYIPLLLLDQFGNYVVQCCLRKGPEYNQYILDAIADKCWEIGQGRFGARAVRAIIESSSVTREQQTYVAAAIIQNTVLLTTNANGVLLLIWLLDTSNLPGRYSALCPRLLPYLGKLCTHKLGSMTVFKIINQTEEPDARRLLLNAIFNEPSLLDDVLRDQVHGLNLVQKIISIGNLERRDTIAQQIKDSLTNRLQVQHVQTYKKLLEELEQSDNDKDSQEDSTQEPNAKSTTKDDKNNNSNNDAVEEDVQWARNPQAVAMMANMYAAAMATAAASMQQPVSNGSPSMPDFSQFDHLIKSLLRNDNVQTNVKDTN